MPTRPTIPQYAINGLPMLPKLGEYIRPNARAQDRRNSLNQIQFAGSLAGPSPGIGGAGAPAYDPASGAVLAGTQREFLNGAPVHNWFDDVRAEQAGRYTLNTIPGTATNNLPVAPSAPGLSYGNDNINQQEPIVQKQPWFGQPWGAASQEQDLPWWMKK